MWPFFPTNSSIRTGIYGFDFQKPNEDLVWLPLQGNFNQESILSYHGVTAWEDKTNGTFGYFSIIIAGILARKLWKNE